MKSPMQSFLNSFERLPSYRSTLGLTFLASLALAGLIHVEQNPQKIAHPQAEEMVAATELTRLGARHLKAVGEDRHLLIDPLNDPSATGMIGLKNSELTSLPGRLESKQQSLNPHFAAAMIKLLHDSGVREGDAVAIGVSGSFPGLNLALYSAVETMNLRPIVVTSVASSSWGANRPVFTWLDMEKTLADVGLFTTRSRAASIGADDDLGAGLSERGRGYASAAIRHNGAEMISEGDFEANVERRLEIFREAAPVAYVNVGGGRASLAVAEAAESGAFGRNIPVIHLRQVGSLAEQFQLPVANADAGLAAPYVMMRYDVGLAGTILVSLSLFLLLLSRQEKRRNSLEARARNLAAGGEVETERPMRKTGPITKPILVSGSRWWPFVAIAFLLVATPDAKADDLDVPGLSPITIEIDGKKRDYSLLPAGDRVRVEFRDSGVVEILTRTLIEDADGSSRILYRVDGGDLHTLMLQNRAAKSVVAAGRTESVSRLQKARVAVGSGRHVLDLRLRGDADAAIRVRVVPLKDGERVSATRRPAKWTSQLRAASWYDSNILRYSQRYIDRFNNGTEPGRFQVESLDDVVTRLDLRANRYYTGFGGRRARVHVAAAAHAYGENDIKNWNRVEIGWRQDLAADWRLDLRASHTPDFYIRHQRDIDLISPPDADVGLGIAAAKATTPQTYEEFSFSTSAFDVALDKEWSDAWSTRFEARASTHDYIDGYDEFDDDQWRLGVRVDYESSRDWDLGMRYRYTRSSARGFDEPGETRLTSDDADATFAQHGVEVFFSRSWDDRRLRVEIEASERDFLTEKPASALPLYAGRVDRRLTVGLNYDFPVFPDRKIDATAFVQWQERTARSDVSTFNLAAEKDYELLLAGLRLTFRR